MLNGKSRDKSPAEYAPRWDGVNLRVSQAIEAVLRAGIPKLHPCPGCKTVTRDGLYCGVCYHIARSGQGGSWAEEFFQWTSEDNSQTIMFRVTRMLQALQAKTIVGEEVVAPMDEQFCLKWVATRSIVTSRLLELSIADLMVPVLGCQMPDDTVLMVDGSHRYFRLYMLGATHVEWLILPEEVWSAYAVIEERREERGR